MFQSFSISEKLPNDLAGSVPRCDGTTNHGAAASNIFHGKPLRFIIHSLSLPSRRCHYNFEVGVITILKGNMAAQHQILDVEAPSLQGGMSFNDWVSVTLVLQEIRSLSNAQRARFHVRQRFGAGGSAPRATPSSAASAGRDRNFDGLCWAPRAAIVGALATTAVSAAAALLIFRSWFLPYAFVFSGISRIGSAPHTAASRNPSSSIP